MDRAVCSRVDHAITEIQGRGDALSLNTVAAALGMSRYSLSRQFEKERGRPLSAYLRECQFTRAKELLETTDLPIKRVALLSGCGTERTLCRLFREITDKPPSVWRDS